MNTHLYRLHPCQGTRDGLSWELQVAPPAIQNKSMVIRANRAKTVRRAELTPLLGLKNQLRNKERSTGFCICD